MDCHLLPFLPYQPSLTAISMVTMGDSSRVLVDNSMAQAMQVVLTTRTLVTLGTFRLFSHSYVV